MACTSIPLVESVPWIAHSVTPCTPYRHGNDGWKEEHPQEMCISSAHEVRHEEIRHKVEEGPRACPPREQLAILIARNELAKCANRGVVRPDVGTRQNALLA